MSRPEILGDIGAISKREIPGDVGGIGRRETGRADGETGKTGAVQMTDSEKLRRLKAFDEEMRKRFGPRWAPPVPVSPEDADPAAAARAETERPGGVASGSGPAEAGMAGGKTAVAGAGAGVIRTKPNRTENEFMLNLMILRNALVRMGPAMQERARRAGGNCWRDIRMMAVTVTKVQEQLIATMPPRRDDYYMTYAQHGHYELLINGPIRNPRMVLIADKYLGALCEAAMRSECIMCMREGAEIGTCLLRQALLEVVPPTEVQDGRWRKCEYRDAASSLIRDEAITI